MVWASANNPPDGTSISYDFRRTVCRGCSWLMMTSIQDTMFPIVGTPVDLSTPKGPWGLRKKGRLWVVEMQPFCQTLGKSLGMGWNGKNNPYAWPVVSAEGNRSSGIPSSWPTAPTAPGVACVSEKSVQSPGCFFQLPREAPGGEGGITVIRIFLPCHTMSLSLSRSLSPFFFKKWVYDWSLNTLLVLIAENTPYKYMITTL